jgi:hypothetical protein
MHEYIVLDTNYDYKTRVESDWSELSPLQQALELC